MRYQVLLFDLFGTIVLFKQSLAAPPGRDGSVMIMDWLRVPLSENLPEVPFDDFVTAVLEVTRDIIEQRPPEYFEVLDGLKPGEKVITSSYENYGDIERLQF